MMRFRDAFAVLLHTTLAGVLLLAPLPARAQDEASIPDTTAAPDQETYTNSIAGEFTPGRGYDILKTERGSINISVYGLICYVNQLPAEQKYLDHLGRERTVQPRN